MFQLFISYSCIQQCPTKSSSSSLSLNQFEKKLTSNMHDESETFQVRTKRKVLKCKRNMTDNWRTNWKIKKIGRVNLFEENCYRKWTTKKIISRRTIVEESMWKDSNVRIHKISTEMQIRMHNLLLMNLKNIEEKQEAMKKSSTNTHTHTTIKHPG